MRRSWSVLLWLRESYPFVAVCNLLITISDSPRDPGGHCPRLVRFFRPSLRTPAVPGWDLTSPSRGETQPFPPPPAQLVSAKRSRSYGEPQGSSVQRCRLVGSRFRCRFSSICQDRSASSMNCTDTPRYPRSRIRGIFTRDEFEQEPVRSTPVAGPGSMGAGYSSSASWPATGAALVTAPPGGPSGSP